MKKKTSPKYAYWRLVVFLGIIALLFWLYFTADCVLSRSRSGIPVDWPNIKDCSY